MEDIIDKILKIDNEAKSVIGVQKEKEKQIEKNVKSRFYVQKSILDSQYKENIQNEKSKYIEILEQKKQELNEEEINNLKKIENLYLEKEETIINSIVESIKNKEE